MNLRYEWSKTDSFILSSTLIGHASEPYNKTERIAAIWTRINLLISLRNFIIKHYRFIYLYFKDHLQFNWLKYRVIGSYKGFKNYLLLSSQFFISMNFGNKYKH